MPICSLGTILGLPKILLVDIDSKIKKLRINDEMRPVIQFLPSDPRCQRYPRRPLCNGLDAKIIGVYIKYVS
jgi:hypothetical protein